jgi:all-trans-retinol 13,14-reductase
MVFCEASTPITQERFTLTTYDTCYGLAPKLSQLGPFRPNVRTHIPGLFLTGGRTRFMFGIADTLHGGLATASAVLDRDLYREVNPSLNVLAPSRRRVLRVWITSWHRGTTSACRAHALPGSALRQGAPGS